MKRIILNILLIACYLTGHSQDVEHCKTTEMMNKWMQENPEKAKEFLKLQQAAEEQDKISSASNYATFRMQAATVYTIPVVFHILHLGGPENISDAQVLDAVNVLNTDFRKLNADTVNIVNEFKALAADANLEFRLATKDEYGNCTNGITRHYDTRTNWDTDMSNYFTTWNPTKYLNIYVVNNITIGAAGYTYLPGSAPGYMDAIVMRHDYVGSIGTGSAYTSRALTHEVGHWFNLQHVWGSTNNPGVACGNDGVNDTPVTKGYNWCNLFTSANCNSAIVENVQNYMEYSYCSRMFTIGQAARMNAAVLSSVGGRSNLHSNANLIATGVINPITPCAPIAEFIANKKEVCVGANVTFTDLSYNGTISSWQWTFQGGTNPTASVQNPVMSFSMSGVQPVTLRAINSVGNDTITKRPVIVLAGPGSGTNNNVQGFESITYPDNYWMGNKPKIGTGWVQTTTVGASSSRCVMIDNYFDAPTEAAWLYTPMFDLSTLPNPALTFDVAYSQNTAGNSNDRLWVYYSLDCAQTWQVFYSKSGAALHTLGAGVYATGGFNAPTSPQWRKEVASLSAISSAPNVLFKFEFKVDSFNPGNNIFIDNINLESASGINEWSAVNTGVSVFPNPAHDKITVVIDGQDHAMGVLEIFDVTGKVAISKNEIPFGKNDNLTQIDIRDLRPGMYFIKIATANNFYIKKIIID